MRSMTGYGQAAGENQRYRINVTLRGVNHRYLDLVLRGLEKLRELEPEIRDLMTARLARGRVEVHFDLVAVAPRRAEVGVEEDVVRSLRALCDRLAERGWISPRLELGDLLRLPEVIKLEVGDPEWRPEDLELLLRLAAEAADQLVGARALEGAKLRRILEQRCDALEKLVDELRSLRAGSTREMADQLEKRIGEILGGRLPDDGRMAQEVAFLVDRSDVAEELDRLGSHLEHLRTMLARDGAIGKRLDFLAQEVFRELNTLAAKCRDGALTRVVVEAKSLCEQIREQVQNVE
ncbi:MAG: YicC/YloC family endoribonuclease [Thermoanaerobaculia bacterium]